MNKHYLLLLALFFLFSNCSRKISAPSLSDTSNPADTNIDFDFFSSKSSFIYQDDDEKLDANAVLRMQKDSVIWININAGLGIEAMRGMVTQDSIIIVDKLKKQFIVYDFKSLRERYNFNLDFNMLQNLILGNAIKEKSEDDKLTKEAKYVVLTQRDNKSIIETFINDRTHKVERLQVSEPGTNNMLIVEYGRFSSLNGKNIPNKISLDLKYVFLGKKYNVSVDLNHQKAEFSEKELKFPFSIPTKYERIE